MNAPEYLRKPQHWQNFEELCLKLWGAIWNKSEEIEFNSTNEQGQNGVDIFCWVDEDNGYVGIQCKNKKEEKLDGTENRIKISDIEKEIEKAESFEPKLKRYIIVTTAEKDGQIQKAIRIIDSERRSQGRFSVEIKFWDYIARKIDEHKTIHDWYLKSQNFKTNQSVNFSFDNGTQEMTSSPFFSKTITTYSKEVEKPIASLAAFAKMSRLLPDSTKYNKSFVRLQFKIKNTGELPIEKWKINIRIEGSYIELSETNKLKHHLVISSYSIPDFKIQKTPPEIILYKPGTRGDILVSKDVYIFNELFIKPKPIEGNSVIEFHWELLSKDYSTNGKLILNLKTKIKPKYVQIKLEDSDEPKSIEIGTVEDYICNESELKSEY